MGAGHRDDGGIGVGQDHQGVVTLALAQEVQLGGGGVEQQAVVLQQQLDAGAVVQLLVVAAAAVQAVAQAAPPGGVDFLAQHAGG